MDKRTAGRILVAATLALAAGCSTNVNVHSKVFNPAHLLGTWFLESWTTSDGHRVQPNTGVSPTLRFDSKTSASSHDTVNDTSWTVRLGAGTLVGVAGDTTAVAASFGSEPVYEAVLSVLNGQATWQITGSRLVIRGPDGSLTYSNDPAAKALGGVNIYLHARAYQSYLISGSVVLTPSAGTPAISGRVSSTSGLQLSHLTPGDYRVTATVTGGTCTPTTVTVVGDANAGVEVACLLNKRQPAGPPTGAVFSLNAKHIGGLASTGTFSASGQVVVRNAQQVVVWEGTIPPPTNQPTLLPVGHYTVSATIKDGTCTSARISITAAHISTVMVACRQGASTD